MDFFLSPSCRRGRRPASVARASRRLAAHLCRPHGHADADSRRLLAGRVHRAPLRVLGLELGRRVCVVDARRAAGRRVGERARRDCARRQLAPDTARARHGLGACLFAAVVASHMRFVVVVSHICRAAGL